MVDVSVVMPVLNASRFLRQAIDSILAQSYSSFELLVVDDRSTDGSREIVAGYQDPRIQLITNDRRGGLPLALNIGLRAAHGEFIARLDADDVSRADRFERQVAFLRSHPDIALVGSLARRIDESGTPIGIVELPLEEVSIRWYSIVANPFAHSSVMFRRREVVEATGGFDESLPLFEDYALWARVMDRYNVRNLPDRLVDWRQWSASITARITAGTTSGPFHQILRALVARQADQILGVSTISAAEADLLTGFTEGVQATDLHRFLVLFSRLSRAFVDRHPAAAASADFQRTLARQYDAIAHRVQPSRRALAVRVYAAALAEGVSVARRLSLPRMAALLLFGLENRDRIRDFRDRHRFRAP